MRASQETRLRAALQALRDYLELPPMNAAERSQFASRLLAERWFRRTFALRRFGWRPSWKGDKLTVLHELAHYLVPTATWATPREKGEAWVRRETTWALLALVQHKLGSDAAKNLRAAYTANGVKYRPRRVLSAVQKARMAERFRPRSKSAVALKPGRRRITFDEE